MSTKKDKEPPKIFVPKDAIARIKLGQAFAEYDKILLKPGVFVKTPAVLAAEDVERSKCFFVGRRGTGKTAVTLYLGSKSGNVIFITPSLFATLTNILGDSKINDVKQKPFISLVAAFKRSLYCEVLYTWRKKNLISGYDDDLKSERNNIDDFDFDTRTLMFTENLFSSIKKNNDKEWTKQINRSKKIGNALSNLAAGKAWHAILLIDRIDDSWDGSDSAVVLLMALMHACIEIASSCEVVQPMVFVRENLFQRVKQIDSEFTRLDTAVVSMDWTEEQLIEMIERRLQINLNPKPPLGGGTWGYFFEDIENKPSYVSMLDFCQNRPRDFLIYCSFAIDEAQSHMHSKVTISDITNAKRRFSTNRLKDAVDEYSENYAQIGLVVEKFYGLGIEYTYNAISDFRIQREITSRFMITSSKTGRCNSIGVAV